MNTQIAHVMKLGDAHAKNIHHLVLYSSWYSFQLIICIIVLPAGLWMFKINHAYYSEQSVENSVAEYLCVFERNHIFWKKKMHVFRRLQVPLRSWEHQAIGWGKSRLQFLHHQSILTGNILLLWNVCSPAGISSMSEFLKDLRIGIVLGNQQRWWARRIHTLLKIPEIFFFPFLVLAMLQD